MEVVTGGVTHLHQGPDGTCQLYRRCCEAAYDTLERWSVNVPTVPNWVDATREPEHIRKGRFLKEDYDPQVGEYYQSHPHSSPSKEMRAWREHNREYLKEQDQQFHDNASAGLNYLVRVLREPFVDQRHPVCLQLRFHPPIV